MEDLYNCGYIHDVSDIYTLNQKKEELEQLEGYGKKSVENLFKSIEYSKQNSLERLVLGLGIKQVGSKTAKILSQKYLSLDVIMEQTEEELTKIPDIGPIIACNIVEYFRVPENRTIIEKLKEYGINMHYTSGSTMKIDAHFNEKTFVLTGTLRKVTRDVASSWIEERGGRVTNSVTKKTNVVIVGDNPGSKYEKALSFGIEIWNEDQFMDLVSK